MTFIHDDFLLQTESARHLYHQFAAAEPILDYHTHLPPDDIATNRRFENLTEIWLAGDHYKWRAMRANGIPEQLCTGDADPYDKFLAWAATVPQTLRNPLYHWTHMELKRYFDIDDLLDEKSAPEIWSRAKERLQSEDLTPRGIFDKFKVRAVCTTDDPTDDLAHHQAIAQSDLPTKVYPTFRPDAALRVNLPEEFNAWVDKLAKIVDADINSLDDLLSSIKKRHDFFHEQGCRLSDHGLEYCPAEFATDEQANQLFDKARKGDAATADESASFTGYMMLHFGRWDASRGWTKQIHIGPLRNNSTRLYQQIGRDIGCDSMGDWSQAEGLSAYLDRLDQEESLPKMILYNINPSDNAVFATMVGNFQGDGIPGKVQWGSGWWFLDQWEGMQQQLNTLSNQGLLSRFVGMLTDSRSMLSYPRHEYFRRCLCDLLGTDVERGALPNDDSLLGPMVKNICFANARDYLGFDL